MNSDKYDKWWSDSNVINFDITIPLLFNLQTIIQQKKKMKTIGCGFRKSINTQGIL